MKPPIHLDFDTLLTHEGLAQWDAQFLAHLHATEPTMHEQLLTARQAHENPDFSMERKSESALLIALAPSVERFLAERFSLEEPLAKRLALAQEWEALLVSVKRKFVQRRGLKQYTSEAVAGFVVETLIAWADAAIAQINGEEEYLAKSVENFELAFARHVLDWLADEPANTEHIRLAEQYSAWATISAAGKMRHQHGRLFRKPEPIDHQHLVPIKIVNTPSGKVFAGDGHWRQRDGFHLTDTVQATPYALDQSHYCIWCHEQGRDACSQGLKDKKTGEVQASPLGVNLSGCPLSEKISEMHMLKAKGMTLAPLAIAMVDNPMIAGTGHRICNECMKSCIYQKQEPVDIPQAETRNLEDVLSLPYGYEIYALLARWNPLNLRRPFTRAKTGKKVLVVGLGPSGYTLAHHLLQDGHTVVAIDGLKIEPLPASLIGRDINGNAVPYAPIDSVEHLMEDLDHRVLAGFGGVSEYGITVRWNKNYLKLLRMMLERQPEFRLFGGVRFGNDTGTITIADALALGFDHLALCMGAGKPTVIDMENGFAVGVRQASDFLMGLQLTGAAKENSLANLQIRMPIVVVGGGLTAIDTATESLAYYVRQVERYARRHLALLENHDETYILGTLKPDESAIHAELLSHGREVIAEREQAQKEGRKPQFISLTQSWGGSTVVYRKSLKQSPAYVLNHEEITKALEEGIYFAENYTPARVVVDAFGHAQALSATDAEGNTRVFPARCILIAAGTQPNTVLAREISSPRQAHEVAIPLDGKYFSAINAEGESVQPAFANPKPPSAEILMHRFADGRMMTFFGDLHPSFFGNVVKAMASAKQGYPLVSKVLASINPACGDSSPDFFARLNQSLLARVVRVDRLTANIVEVVVHAPLAAQNFHPGQFYRLQNFESTTASVINRAGETKLAMEGLALTGAWVDRPKGEVGLIVMEMGGSADLCSLLQPQEPVVLMGPTGAPTEIHRDETVLLAGGGLGNAVLFSIGAAFRAVGSKVLYFAGYRGQNDRYHLADIEAAADVIVWCCDKPPAFPTSAHRPHDKTFVGNIVEAMLAYARGELGETTIKLPEVHRLIAIGSDKMMAAVAKARHEALSPYLKPGHCGVGSINSPMQCMMKEICSQCLQVHRDPKSGKTSTVFSCFNQDQDLDRVDFAQLADRLRQNAVLEKQTARWIAEIYPATRITATTIHSDHT